MAGYRIAQCFGLSNDEHWRKSRNPEEGDIKIAEAERQTVDVRAGEEWCAMLAMRW